jgi:hypothetical protein
MSVSINVSFNDLVQYGITNLYAQMLMTEETRHEEHKEFSDPHGEMTTNRQPIIMQDNINIELIQEALPPKYTPKSQVNIQGKMHHSSLDFVSILQHSSNDFDDVIGEILESSFARQCFPQTKSIYHLLF